METFKAGILTASDLGFRGQRDDSSGLLIKNIILEWGGKVVKYIVLPDEQEQIAETREVIAKLRLELGDGE